VKEVRKGRRCKPIVGFIYVPILLIFWVQNWWQFRLISWDLDKISSFGAGKQQWRGYEVRLVSKFPWMMLLYMAYCNLQCSYLVGTKYPKTADLEHSFMHLSSVINGQSQPLYVLSVIEVWKYSTAFKWAHCPVRSIAYYNYYIIDWSFVKFESLIQFRSKTFTWKNSWYAITVVHLVLLLAITHLLSILSIKVDLITPGLIWSTSIWITIKKW